MAVQNLIKRITERKQPRQHVRAQFFEAERLYRAGSYEEAIELYRVVHTHDPRFRIARLRLGGLIGHLARLAELEDPESALTKYRESYSISPENVKVKARYQALLHGEILRAHSDVETDVEDKLATEQRTLGFADRRSYWRIQEPNPGRRATDKLPQRAQARKESLITEQQGLDGGQRQVQEIREGFAEQLTELHDTISKKSGNLLVVAEVGASLVDISYGLRDQANVTVCTERRIRPPKDGLTYVAVETTAEPGLDSDRSIAEWSLPQSARLLAELRRRLPHESYLYKGVDLLEALSFELEDLTFRQARHATLLVRLATSGAYDAVLFVTSHGALLTATATAIAKKVGSENLYWTSRKDASDPDTMHRYVTEGKLPPVDHDVRMPPGGSRKQRVQRWFDPRVSPPRWPRPEGSDRAVAFGSPGGALFLATASTLHTDNLARIGGHLVQHMPIRVLPVAARNRHLAAYAPLRRLVEQHPERVTVLPNAPWLDGERPIVHPPTPGWLTHRLRRRYPVLAHDSDIDMRPLMVSAMESLATRRLPILYDTAQILDACLRVAPPEVLVVSPDRISPARVAVALCRRAGIPSIFPQVVFFSNSPRFGPLQTDFVTVIDEFTRDLFVRYFGAKSSQVLMTGIPRFDDAKLPAAPVTSHKNHVVLILQRFSPAFNDQLIGAVVSAMNEIPDTFLTVKMHPSDSVDNADSYWQAVSALSDRAEVTSDNLYGLLGDASVVVAVFSNVVLEAALVGKPVLCVNLTGLTVPIPFIEDGLAVGADNVEDVRTTLQGLLQDGPVLKNARSRQEEFLRRNAHLTGAPAAAQIADAIVNISADTVGAMSSTVGAMSSAQSTGSW